MRHILVAMSLMMLWAVAPAQADDWIISVEEAVGRSIASPDEPIEAGWVELDVCGSGSHRGRGYLNSMEDYRDRRSLNVVLPRFVRGPLAVVHGGDPVETLLGKRIQVFGMAEQVRINLFRDGVQTGHYYQTQLRVVLPNLVRVVYEDGEPAPADCDPSII